MLIAGLLAFSSSLWGQETVLLQELDVTKIRQDFGMPLVEGNVLELQAHSVLKMKLDGRVERFRTQIALDAELVDPDNPEWLVQPLVDGTKLLFRPVEGGKQWVALVGKDGKVAEMSL